MIDDEFVLAEREFCDCEIIYLGIVRESSEFWEIWSLHAECLDRVCDFEFLRLVYVG
jgi:hypothetical protein